MVPRPLEHALHADGPNKLLQFDYCYMQKGHNGKLYTLVIEDDLSGYVWLKSTEEAESDTTAEHIVGVDCILWSGIVVDIGSRKPFQEQARQISRTYVESETQIYTTLLPLGKWVYRVQHSR